MTATRREAIQLLEKVPEEKLSYVIQIMEGINGLLGSVETKKGREIVQIIIYGS